MKRRLAPCLFCIVLPALVAASGCSSTLVGSWSSDPNATSSETIFRQVQFKKDGTFNAVSQESGRSMPSSGKYEFDGFTLILRSAGKPERAYKATYVVGGKLELRNGEQRQTLRRQ